MAKKKRRGDVFITACLVSAAFLFLFRLDLFRRVENITYDWRMKTLRNKQVTGDVALVFIGDDTLQALGEWPISRRWYAGLTEILGAMGARAVVFDILFVDGSGAADAEFAAALREAGNGVLPYFFERPERRAGRLHAEKKVTPVAELERHLLTTGFINILPDADGVTRRYPLFIEHREERHNSLCVAVLEDVLGWKLVAVEPGRARFEKEGVERRVPLSGDGSAYLNIYGNLKKFPNYSFVQVFQSYLELSRGGRCLLEPDAFAGKVVLVGLTATGTWDTAPVSGVPAYPLMGVHASFLENFFQGQFLKKAGVPHNFLAALAFSFVSGLAAVSFSPAAGVVFILLFAVLFCVAAFYLFTFHLYWVDMIPGVLAMVTVYGKTILTEFISEHEEKNRIKNLFGRYISPPVMDKMLGADLGVLLQGEKKNLTILFADIRGFTSFAGQHSPDETFAFLNGILSIMSDAVFQFGGTLDKFIGDEVMAVYGAPVDDPDHARHAVQTAVEMMRRLVEFTKDARIGIGINTGEVIIGNIGTEKRMEYTAIGDAVNVAARIEGVAAGDEILVGQATFDLLGSTGIPCEPAGDYKVQGKSEKLILYRVLWRTVPPAAEKTDGGP